MKTEALQSPVSSNIQRIEQQQNVTQVTNKETVRKESFKDDVDISLKGYQRLQEEQKIEDSTKSRMSLVNVDGKVLYRFTDKESGEIIKEIPSEEARQQSDRIDKFLSNVTIDLIFS